jgi:hypothetical protein
VNHDDLAGLPPADDRQRSVQEIASFFNELAETIAEIVTPEDTESALQKLLDRIQNDQNGDAALGKHRSREPQPLPSPSKMARCASDQAAEVLPKDVETPRLLGDLLDVHTRAAADHGDMATGGPLPRRSDALRIEDTPGPVDFGNQQRRGHPPRTNDREPDRTPPDTAPITGTIAPRRAGMNLVPGRDIARAADSTIEALAPLTLSSRDLRMMNLSDREETRALIAGARELLSRCPAGALGAQGSATVLAAVAALAQRLIADRDERAALSLVVAASPHLGFLSRHDPVAFEVRRAGAEALSELGWYHQAETKLRRLADDERRACGATDPRTELLLYWAVAGQDRSWKAEEGYSSLERRLTDAKRHPDLDQLLLHTRCRHAWVLVQLGQTEDSVNAYEQVISDRVRALSLGHAETLDARHSQLKALVLARQFERAIDLFKPLLDDREDVLRADHPDTLETRKYYRVALALAQPHDHAIRDAVDDLAEILHIQGKRLGLDHPMSRDTAEWHEQLLHIQGDHEREQAVRPSPPLLAAITENNTAAATEPGQRTPSTTQHHLALTGRP